MTGDSEPKDVHLARIVHLLESDRPQNAIERLRPWLAEHPGHAAGLRLLALAHAQLNQHELALPAAQAAIAADPGHDIAWQQAGLALHSTGQFGPAVDHLRRAVELDPDDWSNHANFAVVARSFPELLPEARLAALHAVRMAPDEADAHFVVGLVAQDQRDARTAETAYRQALTIDPQHAHAHNNLGTMLYDRGRRLRAASFFLDALASDSSVEVGRDNFDLWVGRNIRVGFVVAAVVLILTSRIMMTGVASREHLVILAVVLGAESAVLLVVGALAYGILVARMPRRVRRAAWDYPRRHRGWGIAGIAMAGLLATLAVAGLIVGLVSS